MVRRRAVTCWSRGLATTTVAACATLAPWARADEGFWVPPDLGDRVYLRSLGLELHPDRLGREGAMKALVRVGPCTGAFVSSEGLIATSASCIGRLLQGHPEAPPPGGFVARRRAEERTLADLAAWALVEVRELAQGAGGSPTGATAPAHQRERPPRASPAHLSACPAESRCEAAGSGAAGPHELLVWRRLDDARLVYLWPEVGDVALLRAAFRTDPTPERGPPSPARWLAVTADGLHAGKLVLSLGLPPETRRLDPAEELATWLEEELPFLEQRLGDLTRALQGTEGPVSQRLMRELERRATTCRERRAVLARLDAVTRRRDEERRMAASVLGAEQAALSALFAARNASARARRKVALRELLLEAVMLGPPGWRETLARAGWDASSKDPGSHALAYPAWAGSTRDVEARWLAALVEAARALPPEQALRELADLAGRSRGEELVTALGGTPAGKRSPPRPLALAPLVAALQAHQREVQREREERNAEARPLLLAARARVRGGFAAPEADGSPRVTQGIVKGWTHEAGEDDPSLPLRRVVEASVTASPALREAAARAGESPWADGAVRDVITSWLTTLDAVEGSEGSPVLDGRGRFVGVVVSPEGDAVVSERFFAKQHSRARVADVRAALWVLDRVHDAGALLLELGLGDVRSRPPAPVPRGSPPPEPPPPPRRGCGTAGDSPGRFGMTVLLAACGALVARGHGSRRAARRRSARDG